MELFMVMVGHVLALCGALLALVGDTWDKSKSGIRHLTPIGWTAALIATIGIGVSAYQSYQKHLTDIAYRDLALNDVRGGWGQVASPWTLTLWEVTDRKATVAVSTLKVIRDNGHLASFDSINLGMTSRVAEYGDKALGDLYCEQSRLGMAIMERSVQYHAAVLSGDIAIAMRQLRQESMFGRLLQATCPNLQRDTPDHSLLVGRFSAAEGRSYLEQLIRLGELLEE